MVQEMQETVVQEMLQTSARESSPVRTMREQALLAPTWKSFSCGRQGGSHCWKIQKGLEGFGQRLALIGEHV